MAPSSESAPYPPELDDLEHETLAQVVKDWTIAHGLAVRPPPAVTAEGSDPAGILATSAPVTLFPSQFPRNCFEQAKAVQKAYNALYARISQNEAFLSHVVQEVGESDDFVSKLWNVHERVKEEGYVQSLSLGLFRSDYMVHQDLSDEAALPQIKQVEFNTIASSFGGLSSQTSRLHQYLSKVEYSAIKAASEDTAYNLPENFSTEGLAKGIEAAFREYSHSGFGHERCVIFLVQGGERNIFDQRHLEYVLQNSHPRIPVFRLPFADILQRTSIEDGSKRRLLYTPPQNPSKVYEVAVVYLRSGYDPSDYPDESSWEARYQIERSNAIKCPTVLTQLAGTKKVQQILATPQQASSTSPSELGRYLADGSESAKQIRKTFTNIFPLDESPEGLKARELALDPQACLKYVLKPQREGGGNNHYKSKIPEFLKTVPKEHWRSFILMELITPPPVTNVILRNGKLEKGGVICELGIYGTCLWNQKIGEVLHNEEAGYLLRTKGDQSEEGGVAAGFGCMDSANLV